MFDDAGVTDCGVEQPELLSVVGSCKEPHTTALEKQGYTVVERNEQ